MGARSAKLVAMVALFTAVPGLAGCTSASPAIVEDLSTTSASPAIVEDSSTTSAPVADPTDAPLSIPGHDNDASVYISNPTTGTRSPVDAACAPHVDMVTLGSGTEDDAYFEYVTPYDLGPRALAQGSVVLDANAKVIEYVVATGDAPGAIAERLCSMLPTLYTDDAGLIHPGDSMNFSAEGIEAVRAKWWP